MLKTKKKNSEIYNDGILNVLIVENGHSIVANKNENVIRFGKKTVGVNRFYQSKIAGSTVDMMIAVPLNIDIERNNIIEINKEYYSIVQIQEKYDTVPPTMYLSLNKNGVKYNDNR